MVYLMDENLMDIKDAKHTGSTNKDMNNEHVFFAMNYLLVKFHQAKFRVYKRNE